MTLEEIMKVVGGTRNRSWINLHISEDAFARRRAAVH
jgi:hypothetical protein